MEVLAVFRLRAAESAVRTQRQQGCSEAEARNNCAVDLIAAARTHCIHVVAKLFNDELERIKDPELSKQLNLLRDLYLMHNLEQNVGDLLIAGYFTPQQATTLRAGVLALLPLIRPDAVALVDAFDIDDYVLCSALGRSDGDVYQALFDQAQQAPFNKSEVPPGYEEHVRPLLRSKL
eukprot:m.73344 g.73344  ORF g.73344 m.73344 type:complete len:177 (+) comp8027_c0_seq4:1686-2216(+)